MTGELPAFFTERLKAEYGEGAQAIFEGFRARRVTSFRVNSLKSDAERVASALLQADIPFSRVDWYPDAFIVDPSDYEKLLRLPLFEKGEIYLQSLSSMLPPLFIEPKRGERILDMTAAPGGKTTQLSALSGGGALITACERDKTRFERLNYNVKRQGAPNVCTLHCDALKLSDFFRFDKILLDAPCSGSGTVSYRSPCAVNEKLLRSCLLAQHALLKKAAGLLREGGTLIYSTCSLLKEENEEQVERILRETPLHLGRADLDFPVPALEGKEGTLTVCPDENFEGFFLAKLVK